MEGALLRKVTKEDTILSKYRNISFFYFVGMGLILLFSYLFHQIARNISGGNITFFDRMLMEWTNQHQYSFLTLIFDSISFFGSIWWIGSLSILILLGLWIKKKSKRTIISFTTTMIGGVLLNVILKTMYQRSRPMETEPIDMLMFSIESVAYSFPSGHTMRAFIFYGLLMYWLSKSNVKAWIKVATAVFLGGLILIIGVSRVYLDAHYPTDILAAYSISLAWLVFCIMCIEGFISLSNNKKSISYEKNI